MLPDYAADMLTADQAAAVQAALTEDPALQAEYAQMKRVFSAIDKKQLLLRQEYQAQNIARRVNNAVAKKQSLPAWMISWKTAMAGGMCMAALLLWMNMDYFLPKQDIYIPAEDKIQILSSQDIDSLFNETEEAAIQDMMLGTQAASSTAEAVQKAKVKSREVKEIYLAEIYGRNALGFANNNDSADNDDAELEFQHFLMDESDPDETL